MLKVGLTGSIAVGKSFVVSVLAELGCVVFDADKLAHSVMEPNKSAYFDLVKEFGEGILGADGLLGAVTGELERQQRELLDGATARREQCRPRAARLHRDCGRRNPRVRS